MLLQNTLDLSTFEIVRFRIWNQTSNPNDYGIGTKYFNTNSGHEGYNRENIYTETGWRRTAYMDDIEALTNGEGSLGARVKALEDMLGLEDVTDVIDTWNDVKAFFDNVDEGLTLMTMLDGKLDKTGGIMAENAAITWGAEGGPFISGNAAGGLFLSSSVLQYRTLDGNNFYDIIHTGNALDQLKGTFLPLTGGTISGTDFRPLAVNSSYVANNVGTVRVELRHNNSIKGHFGWDSNYSLHFYNNKSGAYLGIADSDGTPFYAASGAINTLLHSGNVGEYALVNRGNRGAIDFNNVLDSGFEYTSGSSTNNGKPYGVLATFRVSDSAWQIVGGGDEEILLYRSGRGDSSSWGDWKTIAFTDSTVAAAYKLVNPSTNADVVTIDDAGKVSIADLNVETITAKNINGNAATATRLAKAVSLWGNEFDGTQDLAGDIFMSFGKKVYLTNPEGKSIASLGISSDNKLFIGEGTNYSTNTIDTYLNGYNIYFRTGANQTAMTITEEGNVLVGNGTSHEDARLFSGGLTHVYGYSASPTLGSAPSTGLIVGSAGNGLAMWSTSGAGSFMQAEYFDGTSTALALNLNPLGGAVNVGEGGLNVAGKISLTDAIESNGQEMLRRYDVGLYLGQGTAVQGGLPTNIFGKEIRFLNSGGNRTLVISDEGVASFSNRVLIGGATDDGETALQVNGAIKVHESSSKNYEARYSSTGVQFLLTTGKRNAVSRIDKDGKNIGALAFDSISSDPNTLDYISFRNDTSTWFTINSTESNFNVLTKFNAGALIPTGQTLTIGSVTIKETATGEIEVNGNLHTTGTLASGGKAQEGEASTGNAMVYQYDLASGESVYTVDNVKGSTNVIVQIYEWNGNTSSWDMILTDVSVKADAITVTFGRTTTVNHMVTVC